MNAITVSASSCLRGKTACSSTRTWGTVRAADFFPHLAPLPDQKVMRQERQRCMVVPSHPAPHLVVVQPTLALALLDPRLHTPAHPCAGYARHPPTFQQVCPISRSSLIVMMEATEDWEGRNFAHATN